MGIMENLLPDRKDEKKSDTIVERLIRLIDTDSFFWDKPQKISDFFEKEIKHKIGSEEKTLYTILRRALPKKHFKQLDSFEQEHEELTERHDWLNGMLKSHMRYPSKNLKINIIALSGELIERVVQHSRRESEELCPLARKYLKQRHYKELQNAISAG
jgi:hypothetical protein